MTGAAATTPVSVGVPKRLTTAYTLAASLIAATVIAVAAATVSIAHQQVPEGQRINQLGRQRMLTERVIASGYAVALASHATTEARQQAAGALLTANAGRAMNASALRLGDPDLGLAPADASERQVLDRVHRRDADLVAVIARLITPVSPESLSTLAGTLATLGRQQIALIDSVTQAAAAAQRAHAHRLATLQWCGVLGMLGVLALIGALIMQPAAQHMTRLLAQQQQVTRELSLTAQDLVDASVQRERQNEELEAQRNALSWNQEELLAQQATLIEQRDHLEQRTTELTRLSAILDATPDAVLAFSLTGDILYANACAERLLDDQRKRNWTHAAHAMAHGSVRTLRDIGFPAALRGGFWRGEVALRATPQTPERSMVLTLQTHRTAEGRVATISVMLQDVSAERAAQRELALNEARTRAVIDAMAEGVVVQDLAGRIVSFNASAERVLGLTADQLMGRTSMDPAWRSVDASGAALPGDQHPTMRALRDGVAIDGEIMGVQKADGSRAWLSVNARPIFEGTVTRANAAVATFTDITQQLASARELEALSLVARQSDYSIAMLDRSGALTWVNSAWETQTGYSLADVISRIPGTFLRGTHTDPGASAGIGAAIRSETRWTGEILHYHKDGHPYWTELSMSPTFSMTGECSGFVGLSRDISARRKEERERKQLAAALAVTADGIATTNAAGSIEFVNHAFARMHDQSVDDLLHSTWSALYTADESRRIAREIIPEVMHSGFWAGEATGRRSDGALYPQELSLTLMPHGGLVAVARDISERKDAEAKLRSLSLRDPLTNLYNRRGFLERADSMLRLAARQQVRCALLYGDLDAFKAVNDGFGHDAGDIALQTIGAILTTTFRDTDLIARLGGDEFTILAIDVDQHGVETILSRIAAAVMLSNAARATDQAARWELGISLGAAYFNPDDAVDVERLLRCADEAQYEQKRLRKSAARHAA